MGLPVHFGTHVKYELRWVLIQGLAKKSILAEIAPFVGCGIRMEGALWVQGEVGHLKGIKTCNINAGR